MSPSVRVVLGLFALLTIAGGGPLLAAQPVDAVAGSTAVVEPVDASTNVTAVEAVNASTNVTAVETIDGSTTMWIELGEGGDAHWTVSVVATLPTPEAVDAFRDLAAAFEANESDVLATATFRRYVRLADSSTSRDMALTGVERNATLTNDTGRLELSFTWRNFGLREGSMVHVKNAFTGPNGLWLQGLSADQRLVIAVPEAFDITSAPKGYTNRTIRWDGPTDFEPADFEITYDVNPSEATTPAPTTTRSTPPSTPPPTTEPTRTTSAGSVPASDGGISPAAIVAVVVAVAAVGVFLLRNGGDLSLPGTTDDADGAVETPPDDHATDAAANASNVDDESTPATEESTPATDDAAPIDRELLSDEEYVEALIERNGGRMKQANIVSETGWSNAKVSQLLSAMAEEGRVEKLRIGRENLISFPDDEAEE